MLRVFLAAILASASAVNAQAEMVLPKQMVVEYAVERGALLQGVARKSLARDGEMYTARSLSTSRLLFRMVKVDERSEFRVRNGAIQILRYRSQQSGIRPHEREFIFDYAAGKIFGGESVLQIPAETVLDYANLPFAFMAATAEELKNLGGKIFHMADGRRLRTFTAAAPRMEMLRTPFATLRTLRVDFTRVDRTDRRIHLWLAPELGNVMAQLELQRGRKKATRFALRSVEETP